MNKLILPINAYIVNSNGSIVDAFSDMPSYGSENGADVYHVYNADNNAYYNVLMTEELKAVVATTFNMPYAAGSYTGSARVLTVGSNPKDFTWQPISNLVSKQQIYFNNRNLPIVDNKTAIYAQEPNFLYVTAPAGSAAYISFKRQGTAYGYIYYATNPYDENWTALSYDTSLNVAGQKYYLRGNVNTGSASVSKYQYIATSGANTISFYGDITFLIGNDYNSANRPYTGGDKQVASYRFYNFFKNCAQIIKAPDLPSTSVGDHAYAYMFSYCTNLASAPELPATTLGSYCYSNMFNHCSSMKYPPELPATTLAIYCYHYMFNYCTLLKKCPELPALTLSDGCYNGMFYDCDGLTEGAELPALTLAPACYSHMYGNCNNLKKAPELPATTLATNCYSSMFVNNMSLVKAPELPATTLVSGCYGSMFTNCFNLKYIKAMFTTAPGSSYTNNWVQQIATIGGIFVKNKNATWSNSNGYNNGIPTGWTVYTTAQLHTDELSESYMEDTGKVLMVDASGLWAKKELNTDSMTNVTYSDIKALRDTSALTPGMLYRITDYECTTSVADTSVAGHAFDIVVVADSSDTLNENARAIQNADDDYFDNANLQAWDLKYTIDNDDVYAWATPDGKGVVYYMEDEYGNVCGYDFKNIKFAFADTSSALVDSSDHYYYTFTDASTDGDLSMKKDSSTVCEKNRIMATNDDVSFILPFTVFIAGNSVYNNTILDASDNIFCEAHDNEIDRAIGNVADGAFNFNEVGSMLNNWFTGASEANSMKYISDSKFGGNFAFNTIRYCANVTAGSSFMLNEVGEYFNNSSFGNNCYDNFFGPYCGSITAGNDFRQNTLELQCNNITFGNNCTFNRMGTVSYSRIGNNCYSNQIDGGKYILFGNASNQGGDWIAGNRLIGLTQYVYFYNTNNAGQSNTLRKYHLFNICGTSGSYKHVSDVTRNNSSEIFVLTRPGYSTPDANSLIYVNPAVLPEKTKGGTAGQILVKISGTDYDMGWRTVDVGSQIAYDSSNKTISLKDASGNVLGTPIDATDFIKDGMVSDVSVYDSNLVISFNTDAGKEDISIPLSHIFDSSNYYTKSDINGMFDDLDASLSETFGAISDVIEENELVTAAALTELDTSISELKDTVFNDLDEMRSDISGLETVSPWIYGTGENSAVLRKGNLTAKGTNSISHGSNADASGLYSHAEGEYCKAWGKNSHAEGYYTLAFGSNSHAEGNNSGLDYNPIGKFTGEAGATTYTVTGNFKSPDLYDFVHYRAKNTYARVLDVQRVSSSGTSTSYTVVLNKTLDASSAMNNVDVYRISHVAYGGNSHAEGMTTKSSGQDSHAEGTGAIAAGQASHAEGNDTQARGQYSHAEGHETMTLGEKSHSEGFSTFAFGLAAHAEGLGVYTATYDKKYIVRITGDTSVTSYTTSAEHNLKPGDLLSYNPVGYIPSTIRNIAKVLTTPTATSFTVDKTLNPLIAFSDTSVVKLKGIATAMASHSEGYHTKATGVGSHSEGYDTRTDSSYSHAEGEGTDASGIGSHTEGYYTNTFANYSHAEGRYTRTSNVYEHAQGSYNISHKVNTTFGNAGNTLNTIGIGVSDASRLNAVEIMQNGDVYITGIGNYDGSNYIDASTLQEVINNGSDGATDLMTNVTYSELKALRDSSALIPGMQYRITDYECTTAQTDTSVAGHIFDIIVTADSSTVLNENARAAHHSEDTYFAESNLDAWKLKYDIDNDVHRYTWAYNTAMTITDASGNTLERNTDTPIVRWPSNSGQVTDVMGLIYVFGAVTMYGSTRYRFYGCTNPNPKVGDTIYSFTCRQNSNFPMNINDYDSYTSYSEYGTVSSAQYSEGKGVIYYMCDEHNNEAPYDFKNILYKTTTIDYSENPEGTSVDVYVYTFNYTKDSSVSDYSVADANRTDNVAKYCPIHCYNNLIEPYFLQNSYRDYRCDPIQALNFVIMQSSYGYGYNYSYKNSVGKDSHNITIYGRFNDIGSDCYNISIGSKNNFVSNNIIEQNCSDISIDGRCSYLTIKQGCNNNTLYSEGGDFGGSIYNCIVFPDDNSSSYFAYTKSFNNGFLYAGEFIPLSKDEETSCMTPVTYSELLDKRDNGELIPGMQYYIYDYVTTVGDASLSSAMHPFGIIVTANSSSELDESARMCKAENDEYYTNLDAYEIKYCIDNDSSRFGWVDPNGKGVIYYMKDDNRNEACYDFTNILFDSKYTFDYNGTDARLNASANIHDNVIGPHYGGYASAGSQQTYYTLSPNNIVFEGLMNYNNTFGNDCYDLKFANQTMFNTFDGAVWDCSFGATTLYNHFGSYITGSVFPAKLATSDIGSNTLYINISGTTTYIRCRIMPNTRGTSTSSRLSISITETGQHAGLNSSGVLKKWLPANLID